MSLQIPSDATPIGSKKQLIDYLALGGKPRERWVVGTEHEKLGWWPDLGRYPAYWGPRGIGRLFERLAQEAGWEALYEGQDIVGLLRDRATITLEPGGQLELSGAPLKSLLETEAELQGHLSELRAFSQEPNIHWSGLGMAPTRTPSQMPRMPKARYAIMRRYMRTRGRLALHMMHQTCTVQANFDFADEADAMKKLRLALYLQPVVMATFANSPIAKGQLLPERCFRGVIWQHTDNDRYIFPRSFLDRGAGFEHYIDWALEVPMFFIVRGEHYIDTAGVPFRVFLEEGWSGYRATLGDFALHLSTLFPDARLKHYLEVRGADMGSPEYTLALPALHFGLFYHQPSLDAALVLFEGISYEEYWAARCEVPLLGLGARLGGIPLQQLMLTLLQLSRQGLKALEPEAERLLDPLEAEVCLGFSPADRLRNLWRGDPAHILSVTRVA